MILKITLLLQQYQGNAWHQAHCEGVIDWPPAPWRLLRAIVAGGYQAHFSAEQWTVLKPLLWKMAIRLPSYYLPPAVYLQWRSPRPQVQRDARITPGKTLYSAGLLLPETDSALYCHYPVEGTLEELQTLQQALAAITYLGRRESPAVWERVDTMPAANAYPDPRGLRSVAVLNATLDPEEVWQCLHLSAAAVFQQRQQAVFPGVEQATYQLERSVFTAAADCSRRLPKQVLLTVHSDYRVSVAQATRLCEAVHRRLVKAHPDPVFTGMELSVKLDSHDHVFISPIPDRSGRWIESIGLYAHQGFSSVALQAIAQIKPIQLPPWVRFELADWTVSPTTLHGDWASVTPMFLSRFPVVRHGKPRLIPRTPYQKDGPEQQALQYLMFLPQMGFSGTPTFEATAMGLGMKLAGELVAISRCAVWRGARNLLAGKHGKLSTEQGFNVELEFSRPVSGPMALGYRCHYGFGALAPVERGGERKALVSPTSSGSRVGDEFQQTESTRL